MRERRTIDGSSEEWPAGLGDLAAIGAPCAQLRVEGRWPAGAGVGIVGTRRASEDGAAFARGLAGALARAGIVVVSGGARGIDAAAHEGALEAWGATVALIGSGLDDPYPSGHADLYRRIAASHGCVASELDDAEPGFAPHFLARNRLIAAASVVVVVVEAPQRSGALSTAEWARKLGRELLVVPGSPWDPRSQGCLRLLQEGARVCTSARDVLSVPALRGTRSSPEPRRSHEKSREFVDLDGDEGAVAGALGARALHTDAICRATGLPVARVQRALLDLTLRGLVSARGDGRWTLLRRIERGHAS